MAKKYKAEIFDLKCPNCQSPECFEIGKDKYRCSFCITNFILREETPKVVNNTTIINGNKLNTTSLKYVLIGLAAFVGLMILIPILFVFIKPSSKPNTPETSRPEKERGSVEYVLPIPAKDKVYIWYDRFIRHYEGGEYKPKRLIEIVDPELNKIVKEIELLQTKEFRSDESMMMMGGKVWISVKEGILAFDPNTFEVVETEESLSKKHPEFASGLTTCALEEDDGGYLQILTKNGKSYAYSPHTDEVLAVDYWGRLEQKRKKEERTSLFFVFEPQERTSKELFLYKLMPNDKKDEFTPRRSYFNAKVCYFNDELLIISYQNDSKEEGIRFLQCITPESGNVVWTYSSDDMNDLMGYASLTAFAGTGKKTQMVLCRTGSHLSNKKPRAQGFNIHTGEVIFKIMGEENY